MGTDWNNSETYDRKSIIALNRLLVEIWMLKALLVSAQNKVRRMGEKAYVMLENIYIVINRMLVEIGMFKGSSGEKEMRNMLLETGRTELFIT